MLSHGLFSLLVLSAVSTASPISHLRRSSLIPTPPPACIGKISNSTAVSNNTTIIDPSTISNVTAGANTTDPTSISNITSGVNITDPTSISNITSGANTTTTTCLIPASELPTLMNSTDLSNMTSIYNCTDQTNSTAVSNLSPPSNITDTSDLTPPANSTDTNTTDVTTNDTTGNTTDATNTLSDPPSDNTPPPDPTSGDSGSSGLSDPASGQFTADTTDPAGRRKRRSLSAKWQHPWMHGSSHYRRIAQSDLPDVAQNWQDLCLVSGGDIFTGQPCVELAGLAGIDALLSTGGVCDQQDVADKMIDFAKSEGITNKPALMAAAIAYRQHARNADDMGGGVIPSTPYCTKKPRNPELVGIVNEQLPGVSPGLYGGPNEPIVAFGEDGTCPEGLTPDVSTCSCT